MVARVPIAIQTVPTITIMGIGIPTIIPPHSVSHWAGPRTGRGGAHGAGARGLTAGGVVAIRATTATTLAIVGTAAAAGARCPEDEPSIGVIVLVRR
jgi:hypothetical protein